MTTDKNLIAQAREIEQLEDARILTALKHLRYTTMKPLPDISSAVERGSEEPRLRLMLNTYGVEQEIRNDMELILDQILKIFETFKTQNAKYGSSWKNDGLGPRSLFAESNAKHMRLKNLLWDTPPEEWDVAKIVETLRDRALYDLLTIVKLKLECGIDEDAVKAEVDKT